MKMVGARLMIAVLLAMNAGMGGLRGDETPVAVVVTNAPVMLFPIVVDNKWGYMDQAGNVIIAPKYDCAWDFSEGLACVQVGLIRGYIDKTGDMVIKPKFAWSGKFSGGRVTEFGIVIPWGDWLMFYGQWGGWGYVDTKGNICEPGWRTLHRPPDYCDLFANGPVAGRAKADPSFGLWGFFDRSGQAVITPQYEEAYDFREGLAPVAVVADIHEDEPEKGLTPVLVMTERLKPPAIRNGQWLQKRKLIWGFIDSTNTMVIAAMFEDAWPFSEGMANVQMSGKWGYVDKVMANGTGYSDQQWMPGKWGYIDKTGAVIVKGQYDFAWPFSEGRGRVLLNGKHGYVNDRGDEVVSPQFDGAWEFSKGLARVIVGDNEWYIDPKGAYVWDEAKRKVHSELLALRVMAEAGKAKDAAAKCRAYIKAHAGNAYAHGAALSYLAAFAGADAFDEICAAVEGADPVLRAGTARALATLAGDDITRKLNARAEKAKGASRAAYLKAIELRGHKAGF